MSTEITIVKVYVERYRHVPERILTTKDARYQELQELLYHITHTRDTSPEQEARRLVEALKAAGIVRPRYYTVVGPPPWTEVTKGAFSDT
ncbi:hypothetical protein [Hymenobacter terricola]|uniref:hypothetical protein n=1 Tax=Hymenobacter terricola TaxID=2819236 RepID=UPI001B30BADC|nr:hypothetical protein [Hymenobacter terricola]